MLRIQARLNLIFYVIIGGAISWAEQSLYLTRKRLEQAGVAEAQILAELAKTKAENERLFHNSPTPTSAFPGMSLSRSIFVHKNYPADSRQSLSRIEKPFLAIMGAEDFECGCPQIDRGLSDFAGPETSRQ